MWLVVIGYLVPGSAVGFVAWRLIKTRDRVSIARTDAARAGARLEGARRAAEAADAGRAEAVRHAREAMARTGEALEVARNIELVSDQVQDLTSYLVTRIDGEAALRGRGKHAIPSSAEPVSPPPGDEEPADDGRTRSGSGPSRLRPGR